MIITFYKREFDEMVIEVLVEEFTVLVPEYFEDFWGNEGTLTLRHIQSDTTISVALYEIAQNTFEGVVPLEFLPIGLYQLEGKVRDIVGNASILSAYHEPENLEVQPIQILLEVGYNLVPVLTFVGKYDEDLQVTGQYQNQFTISVQVPTEFNLTGHYQKELNIPCQSQD